MENRNRRTGVKIKFTPKSKKPLIREKRTSLKMLENMAQLTAHLTGLYEQVASGRITLDEAKALANVAGKIISACKTQLDYNTFMNLKRKIGFLEN